MLEEHMIGDSNHEIISAEKIVQFDLIAKDNEKCREKLNENIESLK